MIFEEPDDTCWNLFLFRLNVTFWFRNWQILERGLNFENFRSWILSQNPFLDVNTQIYIFRHVTGYLTGSDLLLLKFHFPTDEIFNFF